MLTVVKDTCHGYPNDHWNAKVACCGKFSCRRPIDMFFSIDKDTKSANQRSKLLQSIHYCGKSMAEAEAKE
eukprot:749861-Hanusia_phi.AAC.4